MLFWYWCLKGSERNRGEPLNKIRAQNTFLREVALPLTKPIHRDTLKDKMKVVQWKKFIHHERILSDLFTKPYFQYHLKSSLSNLIIEMFWYTHNIMSYCVGVCTSKPQQTVKVTGINILTNHVIVVLLWGMGLYLRCNSQWACREFEWSGDHKLAHTATLRLTSTINVLPDQA